MKNKQSINKQHMLAPSVIKSLSKNIFKNAHKIGLNITSQSGALEFTSQLFGVFKRGMQKESTRDDCVGINMYCSIK